MSVKSLKNKMFATAVAASAILPSFADGLPDGYTQLPYLKANANVQVKTGYTPKATDKIVMTWCPVRVNATEALWCARSAVGTAAFTAFQYNSSKVGVLYNSGSTDTDTLQQRLDRYRHVHRHRHRQEARSRRRLHEVHHHRRW